MHTRLRRAIVGLLATVPAVLAGEKVVIEADRTVAADLWVEADAVLEIRPGVTLRLAEACGIVARGVGPGVEPGLPVLRAAERADVEKRLAERGVLDLPARLPAAAGPSPDGTGTVKPR